MEPIASGKVALDSDPILVATILELTSSHWMEDEGSAVGSKQVHTTHEINQKKVGPRKPWTSSSFLQ